MGLVRTMSKSLPNSRTLNVRGMDRAWQVRNGCYIANGIYAIFSLSAGGSKFEEAVSEQKQSPLDMHDSVDPVLL
jgi:hypothetical protein